MNTCMHWNYKERKGKGKREKREKKGQNDFEGSSWFLCSLRLLCDHNFLGENDEEFSQNGPSYTYKINK